MEYKVTKNGETWTDRFDDKESAEEHMEEQQELNPGIIFGVEEMTEEDFSKYKQNESN